MNAPQPRNFSDLAHFTPKQWEATEASDAHRYTLYGGSRGPGKSYWLRWALLRFLIRTFQRLKIRGVRAMLACEDYPALNDRHLSKIQTEFPRHLGSYNAQAHEFRLTPGNGSGVLCFRNLDNPAKYQSAEFGAIGIDELTMNAVSVFDVLRGSLRWPGLEDTRFLAASNPGGPGHLWVKGYWLDRIYPPELAPYADEFCYVPALPRDNPYLSASYWDMLRSLPPDLARAWVDGSWDVFEGQVFGEWRRDLHVIEPISIPDHWLRWRSVDWGYSAPLCCLWLARDPDDGRTAVYRELYQKGLTDPEQADKIAALTLPDETIRVTLADPSMWTKTSRERETRSSFDVYREHGIRLTQADNDRLIGKRRVHDALAMMDDGTPGLLIFSTCRHLIRTLPALTYDPVRVEDVNSKGEDHAYDALRYGLSYEVKARQAPKAGGDYWKAARRTTTRRPLDVPIEIATIEDLEDGETQRQSNNAR